MSQARGGGRLSGQDLAFLAWESARRPMLITVRADFEAPDGSPAPTLETLRAFLAERVRREPRLCARLRRRGLRRPVWEHSREVRIEDHVRPLPAGPGALESVLRRRLDRDRPLWEVWWTPRQEGGFRLWIKVHHALIDGVGAVALLERLLGEPTGPRAVPARREARPATRRPRRWRATLGFVRDQLRRSPPSPLNGEPAPLDFDALQTSTADFDAAADRLGATRNDLALGCITGALSRWIRRATGEAPDTARALCPVDLRDELGRSDFGNRISTWTVPLPLAEPDLATRVARIHAITSARRARGAEHGGDGMARVIERFGSWVAWLGGRLATWQRAHQLVVTSVSGPRRRLGLLGAPLVGLHAFAPLMQGQRLSVALVRYDGRLFLGVTDGTQGDARRAGTFSDELASELEAAVASRRGEAA